MTILKISKVGMFGTESNDEMTNFDLCCALVEIVKMLINTDDYPDGISEATTGDGEFSFTIATEKTQA